MSKNVERKRKIVKRKIVKRKRKRYRKLKFRKSDKVVNWGSYQELTACGYGVN